MSSAAVALVGAGPGDPALLTLRAEGLLGLAEVVVVDAGVSALAEVFAVAAEVVVVPDAQPAVGPLVTAVAKASGSVVRLYRGDPWLHPAHGIERDALQRRGVAVEAVAGVAVEVAVPALAGVPVHLRRLAVACTLGPAGALPAATDPARTLVATGGDPAAVVGTMAGAGDGGLPVAVVPLSDPAAGWRGRLAEAWRSPDTVAGPAVLVIGAVCGLPRPASAGAPLRPDGPDGAGAT